MVMDNTDNTTPQSAQSSQPQPSVVQDIFAQSEGLVNTRPTLDAQILSEGATFNQPISATPLSRTASLTKNWMRILVVAVGVILCIGAIVLYILSRSQSDDQNLTQQNLNINTAVPIQTVHISTVNLNQAITVVDTDGDGLTDDEEIALKTDVQLIDSDQDGLTDREEVKVYATNPLNDDTDNDRYLDGEEVRKMYNPKGSGKLFDVKNEISKVETNSNQ